MLLQNKTWTANSYNASAHRELNFSQNWRLNGFVYTLCIADVGILSSRHRRGIERESPSSKCCERIIDNIISYCCVHTVTAQCTYKIVTIRVDWCLCHCSRPFGVVDCHYWEGGLLRSTLGWMAFGFLLIVVILLIVEWNVIMSLEHVSWISIILWRWYEMCWINV